MEHKKAVNILANGIFVIMFSMSICNTIQSTLLTDIINHYHLEAAMQGMLGSFQSIGSLLSLGFMLLLAERISKPVILIVLSILIAMSMAGAATQPSFSFLIICYVIFGLGKGLMDTTATSMVADLYEGRTAAKKMGILHGVFGIGGLLAPILILQLKGIGANWNEVYWVFAALAVVFLAIYLFKYFKTKNHLKTHFDKIKSVNLKSIKSYMSVKRNYLLMGATFCYSFFLIGYFLWINRYVEFYLGDPSKGALALALFWIGTAISRILLPHLKFPVAKILIWGNIISMVLALVGIWSMSAVVIIVCSLSVGLASGASVSLLLYMGCSWLRENTIIVTMVFYFTFFIGQMISPLAVGAIAKFAGMPWAMTIAIIFAFLSALFVFTIRKEKGVA